MKALIVLFLLALSLPAAAEVTVRDQLACTPDAIKYCIHLKPQQNDPGVIGALVSCLRQKREQLRPACKAVFIKNGM